MKAVLAGQGWGVPRGCLATFQNPDSVLLFRGDPDGFFDEISELLRAGYTGIGYFGYEFCRHTLSGLEFRRKGSRTTPLAAFMFFGNDPEIRTVPKILSRGSSLVEPEMSRERFFWMVERVRDYIAAGDVYQVNISQRFGFRSSISPDGILANVCLTQPVPFACLLDFSDFQVVSGSMELFLRKSGNLIISRPIKGTRPRLGDSLRDWEMVRELRESEKERAENLMIVDLMRNDLSKVCTPGSVSVPRLFEVESYATVHQMFSEVAGRLRDGVGLREIVEAVFPPGSVTGAPKVRAVEIIDELEPHLREPYCGTIALLRPDGDFTMSVSIRILLVRSGSGSFWVGGGVTWGSDPEAEYRETLVKAEALVRALGAAGWTG